MSAEFKKYPKLLFEKFKGPGYEEVKELIVQMPCKQRFQCLSRPLTKEYLQREGMFVKYFKKRILTPCEQMFQEYEGFKNILYMFNIFGESEISLEPFTESKYVEVIYTTLGCKYLLQRNEEGKY